MTALSYEDAIQRADWARTFVEHPYWIVLSKMLAGTIQSETEQMLVDDSKLAINRASIAICRKVIQAPFFDIEQGKVAESAFEKAVARTVKKNPQYQAHNSAARK